MPTKKTFTIGTRGSLLAVTQCTLIKEELEKKTGHQFVLKTIKTQGDQITDKPLWQLEGKDFFTKELDAALLKSQVDLVVHSYKDLGSERPQGIEIGAITKRSYAHDVLLIKNSKIKDLAKINDFVVGTSSPRRIVNIESSLANWLPHFKGSVQCKTLRGNVNSRIQKLRDDQYDAIILALAGVDRLSRREDSLLELKGLLDGLNYLVLPVSQFPPAASQGALAIEYCPENHKDNILKEALHTVHHPKTFENIKRERKTFSSYGGGCHLAVGIHVKSIDDYFLHFEKGQVDEKDVLDFKQENLTADFFNQRKVAVIGEHNPLIEIKTINAKVPVNTNLFITSKYCLDSLDQDCEQTVFSSGTRTAKALINKGIWVNASADAFGHEEISYLLESQALQLMNKSQKTVVLSHNLAKSDIGDNIACYERIIKQNINQVDVQDFDHLYWPSFNYYQAYIDKFPELKNKNHYCGFGKTFEKFKDQKISITPIYDMKLFRG
jgi:hydroxymethylbilane synthase